MIARRAKVCKAARGESDSRQKSDRESQSWIDFRRVAHRTARSARRKPILIPTLVGETQPRDVDGQFLALTFQPPPRTTRSVTPVFSSGFTSGSRPPGSLFA